MSMSQFNSWMAGQGVTKGRRCYMIPLKGVAESEDGGQRRLRVTISTRARDRHGDILEPGGAQIAAYLKNPVVLWTHDYKSLPIGRATSLVRDGDTLKAEILFAPTDFAKEVYNLYAKGFLRAWSVGFLPVEWDVIEDEGGKFAGYHVRSWELIELSAVPVPANPDALTDALGKGLVREPKLMESIRNALSSRADADREIVASEAEAVSQTTGRGQPDAEVPSETSVTELAHELAPRVLVHLRPCLGDAVAREIRRQQGRLD